MSQIILLFHFWHAVHPHPLRGLPSGPTLGASAFGSAGLASLDNLATDSVRLLISSETFLRPLTAAGLTGVATVVASVAAG